jgi:hypothetical protein
MSAFSFFPCPKLTAFTRERGQKEERQMLVTGFFWSQEFSSLSLKN